MKSHPGIRNSFGALVTAHELQSHSDQAGFKVPIRTNEAAMILLLMAEILHQLIGSLSHYLQCLIHPGWCRISSINSMKGMQRNSACIFCVARPLLQQAAFAGRPKASQGPIQKAADRRRTAIKCLLKGVPCFLNDV